MIKHEVLDCTASLAQWLIGWGVIQYDSHRHDAKRKERKEKEKTAPFGVNPMRSMMHDVCAGFLSKLKQAIKQTLGQ